MTRLVCAVGLCLALAACGGGGGGGTGTVTTTTPTPSNPPATSPPAAPVAVAAGTTGVDIVVPGPNNTVNAQFLGVTATGSGNASSAGDQIHRGQAATIIMFGTGLSGSMTVKISGPGDIQIGNQRSITSQSGDSGIAFDAVVSATAVLGARTVFLVSGNDMTSFSGGLEVVQ
jgi:hypothetical protein